MSVPMFHVGEILRHSKGGVYVVTKEPVPHAKLEYCNEQYYEYQQKDSNDATFWIRRQSEMEDGRFTMIGDMYGL